MTITVNKITIEAFNFSGGECHVSIAGIEVCSVNEVEAYLYNADDVMRLIMSVDAIRRVNADAEIILTIPYFPYARQDRVCNEGEAFGAAVMAGLINSLKCEVVHLCDPHSDVIAEHVNNCKVVTQAQMIHGDFARMITDKGLVLVSPDKGAAHKTAEVAEALGDVDVIYCSKVRDTKTGHITHSEVNGNVKGKNLIIMDDICDGGRTFTELAKVLKGNGAEDLYLYVTHGIFSKGLDVLKQHFTHVYCVHSFLRSEQIDHDFLTVIGKERNNEN